MENNEEIIIESQKEISEEELKRQKRKKRWDTVSVCFLSLLTAFFAVIAILNIFVFTRIKVVGESMLPTLIDGDIIIARKNVEPTYGDIIIVGGEKSGYNSKGELVDQWIIKRVIGLGGDSVKIVDGYVYLKKQGIDTWEKLDEVFLSEENAGKTYMSVGLTENLSEKIWELEEDEIFYLGDNRIHSSDSRYFGPCKRDQVVCVVMNFSLKLRWFNNLFPGVSVSD